MSFLDTEPLHLSGHLLETLLFLPTPKRCKCVCVHTHTHMHTLTSVPLSLGEQKLGVGPSNPKDDGKPAHFDPFV